MSRIREKFVNSSQFCLYTGLALVSALLPYSSIEPKDSVRQYLLYTHFILSTCGVLNSLKMESVEMTNRESRSVGLYSLFFLLQLGPLLLLKLNFVGIYSFVCYAYTAISLMATTFNAHLYKPLFETSLDTAGPVIFRDLEKAPLLPKEPEVEELTIVPNWVLHSPGSFIIYDASFLMELVLSLCVFNDSSKFIVFGLGMIQVVLGMYVSNICASTRSNRLRTTTGALQLITCMADVLNFVTNRNPYGKIEYIRVGTAISYAVFNEVVNMYSNLVSI